MDNENLDITCETMLEKVAHDVLGMSQLKKTDIEMFNPLVLAYVGDAVYEAFVRTLLVSKGSIQVSKLHRRSILL